MALGLQEHVDVADVAQRDRVAVGDQALGRGERDRVGVVEDLPLQRAAQHRAAGVELDIFDHLVQPARRPRGSSVHGRRAAGARRWASAGRAPAGSGSAGPGRRMISSQRQVEGGEAAGLQVARRRWRRCSSRPRRAARGPG